MIKIYLLQEGSLQILCIELHVANLLDHHLLHLVAVLLGLLPAALHRRVAALQALLHVTHGLDGLLLALVTDLPGLLLAVLGVAVLLGLLGASLLLQLADLLGLEVAVLFLHWEGEDVGELLTISVDICLAHLNLDLSGDVVAILLWCPRTDNLLLAITIILGALLPLAVELHGVGAGHVVDHLLLHEAVRGLHVAALVVILGGGVYLEGGVTHPVLPSEAPLHLVAVGVLVHTVPPYVGLTNVRVVILNRGRGWVLLWGRSRVPWYWCRVHRSWSRVPGSRGWVHRSRSWVLRSLCWISF